MSKEPKPTVVDYYDLWMCDYCDQEFPTKQQALQHEERCLLSINIHGLENDISTPHAENVSHDMRGLGQQNPRDDDLTNMLDDVDDENSSSSSIDSEDIEFIKSNPVDDLLRIYCLENETIIISMLRTWRTHLGMPQLQDDELKRKVQHFFDWKATHMNKTNSTYSPTPQFHKRNVIGTRPFIIPDEKLMVMEEIDHLCYIVHRDGYPCVMKTVIDIFTDTLFDFRIEVRKSLIGNAGLGLFLTFLGARTLKPDVRKWSNVMKSNRHAMHVLTQEELVACLPNNQRVLVKLKGENLNGNHNNSFFSITRFPLKAEVHTNRQIRELKVTLQGQHLHEDIDFLHKKGLIPSLKNGLGWLNIFSEFDYNNDEAQTFSSLEVGCGLLHLGKYGPLHKTDLKCALIFNLKDFIFCQEPAVWNFGIDVSEPTISSDLIYIDMTDDSTGFPHAFARDNACIYCNEVGHDKNLRQTVLALEKDNGSVHYYIKITNPMKKGDTVELLVSYTESYEESRERKGYGLRNKRGFESDSDLTERTCRNINDRLWIERGISSSSLLEFCRVLDFTRERVLAPINGYLKQNYAKIMEASAVSKANSAQASQKLIARQRLKWVGQIFKHYQGKIIASNHSQTATQNETIRLMTDWNLKTFLNGKISMNGDMKKCIESEFLEEMVFDIYRKYGKAHLFDSSHYCQMSRDLTESILIKGGRYFYSAANDSSMGDYIDEIFSMAKESIEKVKGLLGMKYQIDRDELYNAIGLRYSHQKSKHLPIQFLNNEKLQFEDDELIVFIRVDDRLSRGQPISVSKLYPWLPTKIHVDWFVLSQIVSNIHMIAESMQNNPLLVNLYRKYSLERLCEYLNLNIRDAQSIIRQKIMNPVDADVATSWKHDD